MKSPHRLTADKREIKDFPKSRQVGTSFIRRTLCISEKIELSDELQFLLVNSFAKSFMNKIVNVVTQLGMTENFVEIILK